MRNEPDRLIDSPRVARDGEDISARGARIDPPRSARGALRNTGALPDSPLARGEPYDSRRSRLGLARSRRDGE